MTVYRACLQRLGHLELQQSSIPEVSLVALLLQALDEHDPTNTVQPLTNPFVRTLAKLKTYSPGSSYRRIEELFGANVNVTTPTGN